MNNPQKIITHHALSPTQSTAQDVDAWHKLRWPGFVSKYYKNEKGEPYHVGYHFVIEWSGKVVQTRNVYEEGAHTVGMNTSSIGVCFMGNFDQHLPSPQQLDSWKKLYTAIKKAFPLIKPGDVVPHRRYANKSCHGKLLSDTFFAEIVNDRNEIIKKKLVDINALLAKLQSLIKKR